MSNPTEPPPPYTESATPNHPHKTRSGIPPQSRRSMEDEARSLPPGWIRQYDTESNHQFFVDTRQNPPRSIWRHPYDDDEYLSSLPPNERQRIEGLHRVPSDADLEAESTDDDSALPARSQNARPNGQNPTGIHKLGRKMKDKLTNSTHPEREARRRKREEEEAAMYRRHQAIRDAMRKAIQTGEPQLLGKDRQGKDVYIEPPRHTAGYYPSSGMAGAGTTRLGMYPAGGYGYNPFMPGGGAFGPSPYATGMGAYGRPGMPYNRGYARGYGGGAGLPLAMGLGGGLMLGGLMC
ncbi:hypothetical protein BGAL_0133g00130 [Botrytis galanthina]|uniref:WW domain-containing protein n=1 Tax=Botrytis galanthina TaxID=278940 RepID=A0A4S8R401_9HELO|nr:hypothetical protein BGAL_0133g00130 [Botrytis galanthina]